MQLLFAMLVSLLGLAGIAGIAVWTVRALTGQGPSSRRVAELEREVAELRRELQARPGATLENQPSYDAWPQLPAGQESILVAGQHLPAALVVEVREIAQTKPVAAIKRVRERTGLGLAEAKRVVDEIVAGRY